MLKSVGVAGENGQWGEKFQNSELLPYAWLFILKVFMHANFLYRTFTF